jgi:subtilisin family serine protease
MEKDRIVIGILDEGVFDWWNESNRDLACKYQDYFNGFLMEYHDATMDGPEDRNRPAGDHGYWVLDRLLEVCGDKRKIKVINAKVFGRSGTSNADLLHGLDLMIDKNVDLLNLSLGIPRYARGRGSFVDEFNDRLNTLADNGGFTLIAAGNEGEYIYDGRLMDNTNVLADDPDNNLSVASHDKSGKWDSFSSAGGTVDVSLVGSNLELLGEKHISVVSGTSFSTPSFTGVCANYLINQRSKLMSKEKTAKQIIYEHLEEAIKPVYNGRNILKRIFRSSKSPWFGEGSFESYAKYFMEHYGRSKLRTEIFSKEETFRHI